MASKKPTTALRRTTRTTRKPLTAAERERELAGLERKHEPVGGRGVITRASGDATRRTVSYLPLELYDALDARARENRRNVSETIAALLADALGVRIAAG